MKIILKEDVHNLGQQGDVVEVKAGYARNYLMPKKLAVLFTHQQKKSYEELSRVEKRKIEKKIVTYAITEIKIRKIVTKKYILKILSKPIILL